MTLPKDVLRLIFAELDPPDLAATANVCTEWRKVYRESAMDICQRAFGRYYESVNVPLLSYPVLGYFDGYYVVTEAGRGMILDHRWHTDETAEGQEVSWFYPLDVQVPTQLFEKLIGEPSVFAECFTYPSVTDMCLPSLDDAPNYFVHPQKMFPFYSSDSDVIIGMNVSNGDFGIVILQDEETFNKLISEDDAFRIIRTKMSRDDIDDLVQNPCV